MRHRAQRSFTSICLRLPRALGRTANVRPRTALVALVTLLSVGTAAFAALGSVRGGSSGPEANPVGSSVSRDAELQSESRDSDRALPTEPSRPESPSPTTSSSSPGTPAATQLAQGPRTASASASTKAPTSATGSPSASRSDDRTPPDTSLSASFPSGDSATFSLSADEPASFSCSLDGAAYAPCGSPVTYSDLAPGWHTFAVRAADAAGNVDPSPAETRWHVTVGGPAGE
jgi:hypothetical protein